MNAALNKIIMLLWLILAALVVIADGPAWPAALLSVYGAWAGGPANSSKKHTK